MRRAGGVLLLDLAALEGKYGSKAKRTAEELVEEGAYLRRMQRRPPARRCDRRRQVDPDPREDGRRRRDQRLLATGPREILEGRILDVYD